MAKLKIELEISDKLYWQIVKDFDKGISLKQFSERTVYISEYSVNREPIYGIGSHPVGSKIIDGEIIAHG